MKNIEKSYVRRIVPVGRQNHGSLALILPMPYVERLGLKPKQRLKIKLVGNHLGIFMIGDN